MCQIDSATVLEQVAPLLLWVLHGKLMHKDHSFRSFVLKVHLNDFSSVDQRLLSHFAEISEFSRGNTFYYTAAAILRRRSLEAARGCAIITKHSVSEALSLGLNAVNSGVYRPKLFDSDQPGLGPSPT